MFNFKEKITDYTEMEFIDFLKEFSNPTKNGKPLIGKEFEKYQDVLFNHFIKITEHPVMGDLLFYPENPGDDEPEKVVKIVKEWRRSQGLPLFKDSE
ncbi:bacteriocin immunity protein [Salmonella enterica subsp. salamae]|uniref:Bacteriocin immunity protein n=1 Tax=Salmonella enterica subsp. salamae TaxID=59202 RepID=A0A6C8YG63_SALER|nr:bacteriocin immunity protein [Salmonella enterica]EAB6844176.1 bacteriocin immunity protein [Salmonella enterica subsp. salamae]ECF6027673.1 bacteriocin immunity protein [Salmonella enterica subsp. salamae serovar Greenside]EDT2641293.1 bacteriocin immunity protein [Salmonella enterica subsp. enterica serovar Abony]HCM1961318.1 bacteriocin immunity protein [Salmonella enterica subsp. salamae serovar 56:l,v:z39]ECG8592597.1 bacteriocin immunity protein [Salmonella enterica subsp. salamae]